MQTYKAFIQLLKVNIFGLEKAQRLGLDPEPLKEIHSHKFKNFQATVAKWSLTAGRLRGIVKFELSKIHKFLIIL